MTTQELRSQLKQFDDETEVQVFDAKTNRFSGAVTFENSGGKVRLVVEHENV
jgi:hypothetical protein